MRKLGGFALCMAVLSSAHATPRLSPVWTDYAVIQRDQPILVEGFAAAGETVHGRLGGEQRQAVTGTDGRFALRFAPRAVASSADGKSVALELTLLDSVQTPVVRIQNLLVGDVWLCSGQSNMELSVNSSLDSWNQKQKAADPDLRLLGISQATAHQPQTQFINAPQWESANAQTVQNFSAACYYMAKELRRVNKIPVGVVHASWGGSQIRAWLPVAAARSIYGDSELDLLALYSAAPLKAVEMFVPRWQAWYSKESGGQTPWNQSAALTWLPVPQISFWNHWNATPLEQQANGNVWLRCQITLTQEQTQSGAELHLGILDDLDTTWVNGHPVGNTHGWDTERKYQVPARFLKPGVNEILVSVNNSWGNGGFASSPDKLAWIAADTRIALNQGWQYSISPVSGIPPRAPWDANAGIGLMHNKMVAPLGQFAMQGVAWYQGESDVGISGYQDRLAALMKAWRTQFGSDARMLIVQLANFGAPQLATTESGWAQMRETQRKAVVADKNAALVTAIDLGDRTDIHPANKNELGRRLAMAALGNALPQPVAAVRSGSTIRVKFAGVKDGLHTWSGSQALALELCGSQAKSCRYAEARIEAGSLILRDRKKAAKRVRYAWADSPVVNVYDGRKLPIPGFELPILELPATKH
jgi:sialate O-acetylesterase